MQWLYDLNARQLLVSVAILGIAMLVGLMLTAIVRSAMRSWRRDPQLDELLRATLDAPLRLLIPLVVELVALPLASFPPEIEGALHHALQVLSITTATWLVVRLLDLSESYVLGRYGPRNSSLEARSVETRVRVGRNLGVMLVVLLGAAWVLTTIDAVRQLGTSLLASAGVATVVFGLAAQRSLGTLLAGLQIALTEPIRLDDVVVVQGEGGRIEEITVTYVVVRLWDQRRLVVPITWFLDQPFQNWTRHGAEPTGTLDVKLDPRVSIPALRAELDAILARHPDVWDGRTCKAQVTDIDRQAVTVRILVGTTDPSQLFDLRCAVREELVAFLSNLIVRPDSVGAGHGEG